MMPRVLRAFEDSNLYQHNQHTITYLTKNTRYLLEGDLQTGGGSGKRAPRLAQPRVSRQEELRERLLAHLGFTVRPSQCLI